MQVLRARWRNLSILESAITQSITTAKSIPSINHWDSFHSTDASYEIRKIKFNFDSRGDQSPPKNSIRYSVREKCPESKKALKNLLVNMGCSTSRPEATTLKIEADHEDQLNKKSRMKPARQSSRANHKKMKFKDRRENSFEDADECREKIFEKRRIARRLRKWETGSDWKENSGSSNNGYQGHYGNSRIAGFDDECGIIGTYAERRILGLPTNGPLKIEDVKAAFRSSALRWHPDKHQGPSQANAEKNFKQCVDVYKSLCNALSTA